MRIGVFGSGGMLGNAVKAECFLRGIDFIGNNYHFNGPYLPEFEADVIINCAGKIPSKAASTYELIYANAMLPHVIAKSYSCPIIHVSTDCVFSGVYDEPYPVGFFPDPIDLYGRSKLCGEVSAPHVLNVRTSFIGYDHGLLRWLVDQGQSYNVPGWQNAVWSGSTVWAVARALVTMAMEFSGGGIAHLATEQVTNKHYLLSWLVSVLNLPVNIVSSITPMIDRSLQPTHILQSPFSAEQAKLLQANYRPSKVPANG